MTPREAVLSIWRSALVAAAVDPLVRSVLRVDAATLHCGPLRVELTSIERVLVLGCGKAGASMTRTVEAVLGDRIDAGFVAVKDGHALPARIVELAEAGHPVPDLRSRAAAERVLSLARSAGPRDLVVFLVSGGGSALLPAPAPPVTLEEKQEVTGLLLGAGAPIGELNAVRKHLSLLKGGQLARAASPARILTLLLSDVLGDPLDVIASGPTAPDPTTFGEALDVLARRGVLDRVAPSVRHRLEEGARGDIPETPKPGDPLFSRVTHVVIGNNRLVVDAAAKAAEGLGYRPRIATAALEGEAREAGPALLVQARSSSPPSCLIAGGETTVTVRGRGRGGRCQELALAAALALHADDAFTVLAAGTDGTDGPTDAAGAVVDAATVQRGRELGLDPERALADNDAYGFLSATGDIIITGPTHTNLLDLYLVLPSGCPRDGLSEPRPPFSIT
ncbi:MAG: glycerate kinase type-2 family protein [Gammaproteobacteria bacterium]